MACKHCGSSFHRCNCPRRALGGEKMSDESWFPIPSVPELLLRGNVPSLESVVERMFQFIPQSLTSQLNGQLLWEQSLSQRTQSKRNVEKEIMSSSPQIYLGRAGCAEGANSAAFEDERRSSRETASRSGSGVVTTRYSSLGKFVGHAHPVATYVYPAVAAADPDDFLENFALNVPRDLADRSILSSQQLETVGLAVRTHEEKPDAQNGFLLADTMGCGKGRTIAAIMLHHFRKKQRK